MYYLISNCDCKIFPLCKEEVVFGQTGNERFSLCANVPYSLTNLSSNWFLCSGGEQEIYINFYEQFCGFATKNNTTMVEHDGDKYLFLNFQFSSTQDFRQFEFLNKSVFVFLANYLTINYDQQQIVHKNVENLKFSHYEIDGEFCYIFFEGPRNYLVVINKGKAIWADFYDEYNSSDGERQILKHLCDGLNHGRVLSVKNNETNKYLVYLDDYEMGLKPQFLALEFMDCVLAENFKYCENLVDKSLNLNKENIKEFFPEFDNYFVFNSTTFALFKKNALVGICDFEIVEDKIVNIILD